jgi:hypothetical protein
MEAIWKELPTDITEKILYLLPIDIRIKLRLIPRKLAKRLIDKIDHCLRYSMSKFVSLDLDPLVVRLETSIGNLRLTSEQTAFPLSHELIVVHIRDETDFLWEIHVMKISLKDRQVHRAHLIHSK